MSFVRLGPIGCAWVVGARVNESARAAVRYQNRSVRELVRVGFSQFGQFRPVGAVGIKKNPVGR